MDWTLFSSTDWHLFPSTDWGVCSSTDWVGPWGIARTNPPIPVTWFGQDHLGVTDDERNVFYPEDNA